MKKTISILICTAMLFSFVSHIYAKDTYDINSAVSDTANYLYKIVSSPQVSSIGGEWTVLGLARSGEDIPEEYFQKYYHAVEKYVKDNDGVLHNRKYTEYSRVILALTSIGKDPSNVAGYNLLIALSDYEKTTWQGLNGAVWALIALDCGNYQIPQNSNAAIQATRDMYINYILENQLSAGGWALSGTEPDANITGMAIQALSKYRELEKVENAIEKALAISDNFVYNDSESYVQMIVAYCSLGIDPPFKIPSEYIIGNGFKHLTTETDINLMATEQCFYTLVAIKRLKSGSCSLYDMKDAKTLISSDKKEVLPVIYPDKSFSDCISHPQKSAIETLAKRGIINGVSENLFSPDTTMTRAEFAAIAVRSVGISGGDKNIFSDVSVNDWFYTPVNSAYAAGIIKGISENEFNPYGTVTKEEAAVMTARCAKILSLNTQLEEFTIINTLCVFSDYKEVSDWARESLGFCIASGIIPDKGLTLSPQTPVTRAEIAHMLCQLLIDGDLINE